MVWLTMQPDFVWIDSFEQKFQNIQTNGQTLHEECLYFLDHIQSFQFTKTKWTILFLFLRNKLYLRNNKYVASTYQKKLSTMLDHGILHHVTLYTILHVIQHILREDTTIEEWQVMKALLRYKCTNEAHTLTDHTIHEITRRIQHYRDLYNTSNIQYQCCQKVVALIHKTCQSKFNHDIETSSGVPNLRFFTNHDDTAIEVDPDADDAVNVVNLRMEEEHVKIHLRRFTRKNNKASNNK